MALTFNGSTNAIAGLAVGGLPDGTVDTDTLASSVSRLTNYDEWHHSTNGSISSGENAITAGWGRHAARSVIGSAMTESSGVFTFPSTGIWRIHIHGTFRRVGGNRYFTGFTIKNTTDNGSNWNYHRESYDSMHAHTGENVYVQDNIETSFDVTDVSTHKILFYTQTAGADVILMGTASYDLTGCSFTRIGDT